MSFHRETTRCAMFFLSFTVYRQKTTRRCSGVKALTHLTPLRRFLLVKGKTSKKSMANRGETARSAMLFFEDLLVTDKKRRDGFRCVKAWKALTHLTTPRRFLSVNGKTSKKSMAHRGETTRSAMLFFEDLQLPTKKRRVVVRCV